MSLRSASPVVVLLAVAAAATAEAAPPAITGALDRSGYTVIAVAADGTVSSVRAPSGAFRIVPPATNVTLHLRAPSGKYAGPIVVARAGTRAILGVRAGARLGRIGVRSGSSHARVVRRPAQRRIDERRWARARHGVPIGAGRFGRVRSAPPRKAPPGDLDADGVADTLDVDVDGDRILNNHDRSTRARSAQANQFGLRSVLHLQSDAVVNASARDTETQQPLSVAEIDAALRESGYLIIDAPDGGPLLDCGDGGGTGLVYCSPGGTGRVYKGDGQCCSPRTAWPRFPDDFLDAATGFGRLPDTPGGGFFLSHGAGSAEIGTGDVLVLKTAGGDLSATMQYVFATTPAIAAYADEAGHGGAIDYPVAVGGPGTMDNGLPAAAPSGGGDLVVTFTLWRPQRAAVPGWGESGTWTDIGGLSYVALTQAMRTPGGGSVNIATGDRGACPQSALSIPPGQPLRPVGFPVHHNAPPEGAGALTDTTLDGPPSPASVLTLRVNVTQCLASMGLAWAVGDDLDVSVMAVPGPDTLDNAATFLTLRRVG